MDDWNDLRYFLAVARGGGLTHAASALGVSPATVSRRIDAFEQVLGIKLFIRHQTGYVLTDDGERIHESALPVEQAMQAFGRQTQDAADAGRWSGNIRVACPELIAAHWITPRLGEFFLKYPGLRVELTVGLEQVNLSRRDADIALRFVRPGKDEEGDYIGQALAPLPFAAYRSALHALDVVDWRALPHISWSEPWSHLPMAKWLATTFPRQPPVFASNSLNLQYIGACAGLGVVVLPTFVGDNDPRLVRVEPDQLVTSRPLWLVFHRDLRGSERLGTMRNFLTSIFGD
jgi:DNA-binding transcriptional LysR family regulator